MASGLFVGIDAGTQGVKVLVWDQQANKVVSRGGCSYPLLPTTVPGRAEQHPSTWLDGTRKAMQAALQSVDCSRIRGIGVSGQQHGLVALDASGNPLRPAKLWCDVEAAAEAQHLSAAYGIATPPGFTAPKLLWLKNKEPHIWEKMQHVLLPHDYLNYWLTGEYAMEAGDASGTALLDITTRAFDSARIDAIDPALKDMLPQLVQPTQSLGPVREAIAEEFGLPTDCQVSPGGGDNMMSALGCGAVRPGVLVCSLGTSGTLFGASDTPVVDPSGTVAPFCDCTGRWLPLLCTQNCTLVSEEIRSAYEWGLEITSEISDTPSSTSSRQAITALAQQQPAGCDGLTMLPYLTGERTPNWPEASGAFVGLRPGMLGNPGLMYRAALESATFSLLAGYITMEHYGIAARQLLLVGGGSANTLWQQIVADAFGMPVALPQEAESAALGGALQAAAVVAGASDIADFVTERVQPAGGVVEPASETREALMEAFQRHQAYGKQLFGGGHGDG